MSFNAKELKRCPACEGITGQSHLPDCFVAKGGSLGWLRGAPSALSQPDGYAGTPEPEKNASGGSNASRTAAHQGCSDPCCLPELYRNGNGIKGSGRTLVRKEDGSYDRVPVIPDANVPRNWTPTPLYRAVMGPNGPSLELVPETVSAREIALEERLQQANETIKNQQERIEYAEMKVDAYRKVWSARAYLEKQYKDQRNNGLSDNDGWFFILTYALQKLDEEQVDGPAIRAKYNSLSTCCQALKEKKMGGTICSKCRVIVGIPIKVL